MTENRYHNRHFDAEEKDKIKLAQPPNNESHTVDLIMFKNEQSMAYAIKSLEKSSRIKIVRWSNSKFKHNVLKSLWEDRKDRNRAIVRFSVGE
jgi:hypothetical protein